MLLNLLKTYWYWAVILLLLVIASASVVQCSRNAEDIKLLTNGVDSLSTSVKYYETKMGEMAAQIKTKELTIEQLKKYGVQLGYDKNKLEKQVGNLNRIVAHWKGKAEVNSVVYVPLTDTLISAFDGTMDLDGAPVTVEAKRFEHEDKYLKLWGIVDFKADRITVNRKYRVDFELTGYYKPQGIFKPKQLVADVIFSDPDLVVKEFKGFVIQPPKKKLFERPIFWLGIGLTGGLILSR